MPIVADNLLAFKILFEILFKINTALLRALVDLVRGLFTAIRIHECHSGVEQQSVCSMSVTDLCAHSTALSRAPPPGEGCVCLVCAPIWF